MVGLKVDVIYFQIGHSSFFYSFFSTIAYRLEGKKWGSRFPVIMNEFCDGTLSPEHIDLAEEELRVIQSELKEFQPDQMIWNFDDLSAQPPWGDQISESITDLSNYYVTADGRDLITVLFLALGRAKDFRDDLKSPVPLEIVTW